MPPSPLIGHHIAILEEFLTAAWALVEEIVRQSQLLPAPYQSSSRRCASPDVSAMRAGSLAGPMQRCISTAAFTADAADSNAS